jgi:hypothetical protein
LLDVGSLAIFERKPRTGRLEWHSSGAAMGGAFGLLAATDGFSIGAGFAAGGETCTVLAPGLSVWLPFRDWPSFSSEWGPQRSATAMHSEV